jgi:alkylhydroperoxidase family enzyme
VPHTTNHSSVPIWRRDSFLTTAHRLTILWSLLTIVVCGVVKHAIEHRMSSDQNSALTRILRAASAHRIRRLAGSDCCCADSRLSNQSVLSPGRLAVLSAIIAGDENIDDCLSLAARRTALLPIKPAHAGAIAGSKPPSATASQSTNRWRC